MWLKQGKEETTWSDKAEAALTTASPPPEVQHRCGEGPGMGENPPSIAILRLSSGQGHQSSPAYQSKGDFTEQSPRVGAPLSLHTVYQ